ncbi:glycosyltransferase family 4 protein [Luteimonas marina]|uniref:Glycosyltransferase family 4 protein n=1 Tax=Luteimonas marina TaxID=488485 RepID=A0A5C5TUG9_9GAMM|nr:glycosyltransferase [Luteimonas marina]TWT17247.1 glycosyltransferase family 4 protein [Luteimonas marina]
MNVLALTNLFPSRWDPLRASFNRQQFDRLAARHDLEVLVAVDFRERRGPGGEPPALAHARTSHFTFWYPPGIGRSLHGLAWYASLLAQHGARLKRKRFDVLLASWGYPDAVGTAMLARRLGLPYVVKVHGSDLNVQAKFRLRRPQVAAALRGARAVVAVSAALSAEARALGVEDDRVHLLYNGVDGDRFFPGNRGDARRALGLPQDVPIMLYAGNLKVSKGCIDLLEAFPAVLERHPGARLVFVGGGAAAALNGRARELAIAENVLLAGPRPHHELADWMRAASLLCLPSHNEGVPNVVLEAMACGLPVVATRVGGIPEVLPEYAGTMVPAHDRLALAQALDEALGTTWSIPAIVAHASRFDWQDNVERLDRILQNAARPIDPTRP